MTGPTQATCFDGWAVKTPSKDQVRVAAQELSSLLGNQGWTISDNTAVLTLETTADIEHQVNIPTHVTIGFDDIRTFATKLLQSGVESPGKALDRLLKEIGYHVTVSEADEIYAKSNPRWFSENNKWSPSDLNVGSRGLAAAVKEAKSKLGRS